MSLEKMSEIWIWMFSSTRIEFNYDKDWDSFDGTVAILWNKYNTQFLYDVSNNWPEFN